MTVPPTRPDPEAVAAAAADEGVAWPPRRRSAALPVIVAAMVAIGAAAGAYMVWHAPLPPDPDGGGRCARTFDARLRTARGGTDADLVELSNEALAAGCGAQALDAADAVDWKTDEAAAWTLARFYDPRETDPVFRRVTAADPARAATYDLEWASRSPRMADALKALCATDGPALDRDPTLKTACGR